MTTNLLSDLYIKLTNISRDHAYIAMEIPGHPGIYLAVDLNSDPCIFISAKNRLIEPPLKTTYVSLLPNQSYRITLHKDNIVEGHFHAIICTSPNHADITTFLSLLEVFIDQNNNYLVASENVMPFFRNVVKLFSVQPAKDKATERQGLWGELFVMRSVKSYRFWAPFWHNEFTDVFDFSTSKKRLEIKTSASGQRIHHITHGQVFAMHGEEIVFASLMVNENQANLSLRKLIDECKTELVGSMNYFKIEKAARYAGMHDSDDLGPCYNLESAKESLAFFNSNDIPHFAMPEPPGVSQTSFRADLRNAPRIDDERLDMWLDTWLNK